MNEPQEPLNSPPTSPNPSPSTDPLPYQPQTTTPPSGPAPIDPLSSINPTPPSTSVQTPQTPASQTPAPQTPRTPAPQVPTPQTPAPPTPPASPAEPNSLPPDLFPPPVTTPTESNNNTVASVIWALLLGIFNWLLVPAAIVLILHFFVFQAFHVVGNSMNPTLSQSDYLIISKLDATWSHLSKLLGKSGNYIPQRDQIIVFRYPGNPDQIFIKRVIGLPGEHVVIKAGKVTVFNSTHPAGINPDQSHLVSDPITLGDVDETVQPGKIFVMGDNRSPGGSYDSRDWGELPSENILGNAILRLLPFNKFKILTTS